MQLSRTSANSKRWFTAVLLMSITLIASVTSSGLQQAWAGGGLDAAKAAGKLAAQATHDFESADGLVRVTGITSGKASYDTATKTLAASNLKAEEIVFLGDSSFKLELVGVSKANVTSADLKTEADKRFDESATVTTTGKGKLSGRINIKGNLSLSGGQVGLKKFKCPEKEATISCAKLTVSGGKLVLDACDGTGIRCSGLVLSKGSITVHDQYGDGIQIDDGNLKVSGGKLSVTKCYGNAVFVGGHSTPGYTYRGKTVPDTRHFGDALISDGTVTLAVADDTGYENRYGLYCFDGITIKGGTIRSSAKSPTSNAFGIACQGKFATSKSSVVAKASSEKSFAYGIHCGSLSVKAGKATVTAKSTSSNANGIVCKGAALVKDCSLSVKAESATPSYYSIDGINCSSLSIKGGNVKATAISKSCGARGVYCSAKLAVSGGALTAKAASTESYSRGVECKKLSVRGGEVRAYSKSKNNWSAEGLKCPSASVRGKGSVIAKGNGVVQYKRVR